MTKHNVDLLFHSLATKWSMSLSIIIKKCKSQQNQFQKTVWQETKMKVLVMLPLWLPALIHILWAVEHRKCNDLICISKLQHTQNQKLDRCDPEWRWSTCQDHADPPPAFPPDSEMLHKSVVWEIKNRPFNRCLLRKHYKPVLLSYCIGKCCKAHMMKQHAFCFIFFDLFCYYGYTFSCRRSTERQLSTFLLTVSHILICTVIFQDRSRTILALNLKPWSCNWICCNGFLLTS